MASGEFDLGALQPALTPPMGTVPTDLMTKISYISPGSVYDTLDVLSRDMLMYLADDLV
jgi:hypothetical protein